MVYYINTVDCEEDSIAIDNIGDDGMIEGSEMQHGSMINYTCADMCSYKRTCTDGTWQGNEPDCPGNCESTPTYKRIP